MATSAWFARENGRDPKKPREADKGLGCGDSMIAAFVSSGLSVCALRPHRIATKGFGLPSWSVRALRARIASSVICSHPLP